MNLPATYDAWRLAPPEPTHEIGLDAGDTCNRFEEPDEDQPCGYRLRACNGTMIEQHGVVVCDTCEELA